MSLYFPSAGRIYFHLPCKRSIVTDRPTADSYVFAMTETDLLTPLKRYWGYDAFRPLQERIVRSLMAGKDVCVVMPTGGGKSLCYQLPALVMGRTTVVISPLIALMQDQGTQLAQMGVSAAVLNSVQSAEEQQQVMKRARAGEFRLLYLSPERLARADTLAWLKQVPVGFFAIDEAHCISEWGHEFRPEYRQLSCLRQKFPERPIAAFTASATRQVRHDILQQLQLRTPDKYIASFHRTNLRYVVQKTDAASQLPLLVRALRNYGEGSVIVYAPTIIRVEQTVDQLEEEGIAAVGYHGQMGADQRRKNQERWTSDEVRVVVGTVAFGLGINKAAVRAVIHLSLPKSIEQYYQEAGRAGRDGAPADCVMMWQGQDAGLLGHFAEKIEDKAERERAWQRYHTIRRFVESRECRHRQVCLHFGETPKWATCGACDVCGATPEWMNVPVDKRPRQRRRKLASAPVAAPAPMPAASRTGAAVGVDLNSELREFLQEWRRDTARRQKVPAYVVMHDTSLEELCRMRPTSLEELAEVSGFGERKTQLYGEELLVALTFFSRGGRAKAVTLKQPRPAEETMQMLAEGKSFEEIAEARGRQVATVVGLVANLVESGQLEWDARWVDEATRQAIEEAARPLGLQRLRPIKEALAAEITYEQVRLAIARMRREQVERERSSA